MSGVSREIQGAKDPACMWTHLLRQVSQHHSQGRHHTEQLRTEHHHGKNRPILYYNTILILTETAKSFRENFQNLIAKKYSKRDHFGLNNFDLTEDIKKPEGPFRGRKI